MLAEKPGDMFGVFIVDSIEGAMNGVGYDFGQIRLFIGNFKRHCFFNAFDNCNQIFDSARPPPLRFCLVYLDLIETS